MPTIICPFCQQSYDVEPDIIGEKVRCAVCNGAFIAQSNRSKQQDVLQTKQFNNPPYHFIKQSHPKPPQYTYNPSPSSSTDKTKQKNNAPVIDIKNIFLSLLAIAVIIVLGVGTMASGEREHNSSSSSSSSHIEINGRYHMPSGAVGFTSKDNFEKFRQLCKQKDSSASKSYLVTHMVAGDAIMFSGGETVIVSDLSPWSGMAKVRKDGDYQDFWVYSSWLE